MNMSQAKTVESLFTGKGDWSKFKEQPTVNRADNDEQA
jgi:hypothetical protein